MSFKGRLRFVAPLVVLALLLSGATAASAAKKPKAQSGEDLEALIKAARAEGTFTFYASDPEPVARALAEAFKVKYNINYQIVRAPSTQLIQRFATEASSGVFAADFMLAPRAGLFMAGPEGGLAKGWVDDLFKIKLPALTDGTYPKDFLRKQTAVVGVLPWGLAYNTQKVTGKPPKDFSALVDPQYKGKVIIPNPRAAESAIPLWGFLQKKYGKKFFTKLEGYQLSPSGTPAIQSLAAGEGSVEAPTAQPQVTVVTDAGAPVKLVIPDHTTGIEQEIVLTASGKAKHPNAARLFASWLLSKEGNTVYSAVSGSVSVYDTSKLPKQYSPPTDNETLTINEIAALLKIP